MSPNFVHNFQCTLLKIPKLLSVFSYEAFTLFGIPFQEISVNQIKV